MTKTCPNSSCGMRNDDNATYCKACHAPLRALLDPTPPTPPARHQTLGPNVQTSKIHLSNPFAKSRLSDIWKGLAFFPQAVYGGTVGGAVITFIGAYIYMAYGLAGDRGLVTFILAMVLGSFIFIPLSLLVSIAGAIVGLIMGVLTGCAGFLLLPLTTNMDGNLRTGLISFVMANVGAISTYMGYSLVNPGSNSFSILLALGGGLFGLMLGFLCAQSASSP